MSERSLLPLSPGNLNPSIRFLALRNAELTGMINSPNASSGVQVDRYGRDVTPASLFSRLRRPVQDEDPHAFERNWTQFVSVYGPMIYSWCCGWGLQNAANDVTQDVLTRFIRALPDFKYDPNRGKFRGWLKTVTIHVLDDLRRERRKS